MCGDKEKVKEDVLKNPKHVLVTIQVLMLQGKPILKAYNEFCNILGDDVMEYNDFDFWWFRFLNGEFDLDYDRNKEPKKRELGDMPIKIVKKIIGKLENQERYVLPNVSKGIRNVMEESNLLISNLCLTVNYDWIDISFNGRKAKFEDSYPETIVSIGETKRTVEGDYLIVAANQLTRILNNPKLRFDSLNAFFEKDEHRDYFIVERNFNAIRRAFHSITHQIHVKTFKVNVSLDEKLMTILPYLKPGVLETIEIHSEAPVWCGAKGFVELEQFKQAKSFTLKKFYFDAPIEKLLHLNNFEVTLETISIENVTRIKDAFLASPNLKRCCIHLENVDNLRLLEALDGKVFAIPGSKDSIRIQVAQFKVSIDRVSNK